MICTDGETVRLEIGRLFPPQGGGGGWGRISHGTSGTSVPSFLIVRFFFVCVCVYIGCDRKFELLRAVNFDRYFI